MAQEQRTFTEEERRAYAQMMSERREDLTTRVNSLVASFQDSDAFKKGLSQIAEIHHVSETSLGHGFTPTNLINIVAQLPTDPHVGTVRDWQAVGREVKEGTTPIWVWVPVRTPVMQDKRDANGQQIMGADGKPEREPKRDEKGEVVRAFSGGYGLRPVYELNQTEGQPLPEYDHALMDPADHFQEYVQALKEVSPLPIRMSDEPKTGAVPLGFNETGACSHQQGLIVIRQGMSPEETLKAMVQQIANAFLQEPHRLERLLVDPDKAVNDDPRKAKRGFTMDEIKAQAVCGAYLVCERFRLDTSDLELPFPASWQPQERSAEFAHSLGVVLNTAERILEPIEPQLMLESQQASKEQVVTEARPAVDLQALMQDRTAAALRGSGFTVRLIEGTSNGEPPYLAANTGIGTYGLSIRSPLIQHADGTVTPAFDKENLTTVQAFDINVKNRPPELIFEAKTGSLDSQLAQLKEAAIEGCGNKVPSEILPFVRKIGDVQKRLTVDLPMQTPPEQTQVKTRQGHLQR